MEMASITFQPITLAQLEINIFSMLNKINFGRFFLQSSKLKINFIIYLRKILNKLLHVRRHIKLDVRAA
jgi:hypothetical protein